MFEFSLITVLWISVLLNIPAVVVQFGPPSQCSSKQHRATEYISYRANQVVAGGLPVFLPVFEPLLRYVLSVPIEHMSENCI